VGIVLALLGKGVWALVFQSLANAVTATMALWWVSRWRPSFRLNFSEVRRISGYSANLTGFNLFNYFARNADYLLIGRFLGPFALGLYTLAYKLMLYPLQSITNVISRVVFPAFSEAQDDNARLRRGYLRTVSIIGMATFPMMVGLWVVASPFVTSLFGSKWQPVVPLIRIFAPLGMFQSVIATVGAIYQAKGRTDLLFRWGVASGIIYVAGFAFGLRWGIIGVAFTYMVLNLSLVIPSLLIPFALIDLRLKEVCRALRGPLVGSIFMGLTVLGIHNVLPPMSPIVTLQLLVVLGVAAYGLASWTVNRHEVRQVLNIVGLKS
jgi:PST family polysaccharide transporter